MSFAIDVKSVFLELSRPSRFPRILVMRSPTINGTCSNFLPWTCRHARLRTTVRRCLLSVFSLLAGRLGNLVRELRHMRRVCPSISAVRPRVHHVLHASPLHRRYKLVGSSNKSGRLRTVLVVMLLRLFSRSAQARDCPTLHDMMTQCTY